MKIFKTVGYEYNELSSSAKEKAKQWYLEDDMRSDMLTEDFEEMFAKYFFKYSNFKVQWSLSSCQGDGVNIYGMLELIDIVDYIKNWNNNEHNLNIAYDPTRIFTDKEFDKIKKHIEESSMLYTNIPSNNRYCYCIADQIEFATDMIEELEYNKEISDTDKELIYRFEKESINIMESLCKEMENYGYTYLYECSDEELEDVCNANSWYFDEEGNFIA